MERPRQGLDLSWYLLFDTPSESPKKLQNILRPPGVLPFGRSWSKEDFTFPRNGPVQSQKEARKGTKNLKTSHLRMGPASLPDSVQATRS